MAKRAIYYDLETTGVDTAKDRIVEIAAYDPELNRTFEHFVNPGCLIPPETTAIHNITNEMVKDAPSFAEIGKAFIEFCEGDVVLIAHNNESFDSQFLRHESKRHEVIVPNFSMIDSLKWSRKYRSDLPRHNLQFLRNIYGFPENGAHRALNDVLVLHKVFTAMIDDLSFETILSLMSNEGANGVLPTTMPFGKYRGKALDTLPADYVRWLKDQGALDKPENSQLKEALEKIKLL